MPSSDAARADAPKPRQTRPEGRVPPHSIDAEQSVLGSILLSTQAIDEVLEFLQPEDFYRENNGQIFRHCVELWRDGEPIDTVTLAERLEQAGVLAYVGGRAGLAMLQEATPTAANIEHYARIVREHSLRRQLIRAGDELGKMAYDLATEAELALQQAEQMLFKLGDGEFLERTLAVEQVLRDVLDAYGTREPGQLVGLSTGFTDVDRKLNGLKPGEVYIVAARPNMGKSSWAFQVARNVAGQGVVPVIFSLEMSADQVVTRLLCQEARIDSQRFERHELSEREFEAVVKAAGPLAEAGIIVDDTPRIDEIKLLHRVRQLRRRRGVGLVVIDYVQLMEAHFRQPTNRVAEVTAISKALKGMARDLKIPVLAVSQLSRATESRNRGDHRPELSDLRESGSLEQDAAAVAFLYRPEYYKEGDKPGICEVIVKKNRFGPVGTVELVFRSQLTRFENKAKEVSS